MQTISSIIRLMSILVAVLIISGCRTWYQKNRKFNEYYLNGQLEKAEEILASDKKAEEQKNRVLYFLNLGLLSHMQGEYAESNELFEKALLAAETIGKNYALESAALLTNPNVLPYKGEDFELLMVNYYKALNYMYLKDYDAALVECRRMDIKMAALADKYKKAQRYKHDAFIHNLMGIIYDADRDYNNAFIAYRNAYNYYKDDYSALFGMTTPLQLKKDLLRAAYRTGFHDEVEFYEKEFGMYFMPDKDKDTGTGELVFFWHNGMGPVKEEWGINFYLVRGEGGIVTFVNEEFGWSFPFPTSRSDSTLLGNLHMIRVALPKYVERIPQFSNGRLMFSGKEIPLETGENISAIAFQSLKDRLTRDLGNSLMRLALKKSAEMAVRKQNQDIGAAIGVVNFLTEHADTRHWQTIPHSIYYGRAKLPEGEQKVQFRFYDGMAGRDAVQDFIFHIRENRTEFFAFHTPGVLKSYHYRGNPYVW